MLERTLAIIKPDGVKRGLVGEVVRRIEKAGFRIVAMKMLQLTRGQAQTFYAVHKERPFFEGLIDFMSSGPCVVLVLEGKNVISRYRDMMGATDPQKAADGTIRKAFATDGQKNAVHGSDASDTAAFEINYFFSACELMQ